MQTIWESPGMKARAVLPDSLPEKHDAPDQSQRRFPLLESCVWELVGTGVGCSHPGAERLAGEKAVLTGVRGMSGCRAFGPRGVSWGTAVTRRLHDSFG